MSHFLFQLARSEFQADGLDPYMFGLLVHVHDRGTMTPTQLAGETRVMNTTIRDQVQNLVDRGLLARKPNPEDARSYLVELTTAGERFYERGTLGLRPGKRATCGGAGSAASGCPGNGRRAAPGCGACPRSGSTRRFGMNSD